MSTHQSLECLFSAPLKTPPSFSPHSRSCNLEATHKTKHTHKHSRIIDSLNKMRGLLQRVPWCLTLLQAVHNLQPDDVTFVKTEHRAVVRHKVSLCDHIVWVLKMERKNTHRLILSEFHKGFCTVICMYSDFKFTAASVVDVWYIQFVQMKSSHLQNLGDCFCCLQLIC